MPEKTNTILLVDPQKCTGCRNVPVVCRTCADAPCIKACPMNARRRSAHQAVITDEEGCIGCRACIYISPFGAPVVNPDDGRTLTWDLCADDGGDCVETVDACTGEDAMFQLKHNAIEQARVVAHNLIGEPRTYPGAWAFARAHFFDMHAVTFGKATRATPCERGQLEIIERKEGEVCLRIILKGGLVVGGQAIGRFGDFIGLFIGAMWRKDRLPGIRENWPLVARRGSPYPWITR